MQRQPKAVLAGCAVRGTEQFEALESGFRRIPLLPAPFYDETLGSWLHRGAIAHGLASAREFAASLLAMNSPHVPLPGSFFDFDTQPPPALLAVLAKRSGFPRAQFHRMTVSPGGSVLRSEVRDVYCPRCFEEDLKWRAVYVRRAWLDAWTLTCARHRCLLGHYTGFSTAPPLNAPKPLMRDEQVRLGVEALGAVVTAQEVNGAVASKWLKPALLGNEKFRRLVLLAGSIDGEFLYSAVLGHANAFCWKAEGQTFLRWSEVIDPCGPILARIRALYVASVAWPCIDNNDQVPASAQNWLRIIFERMPDWNANAMKQRITVRRMRAPETRLSARIDPSTDNESFLAAWLSASAGRGGRQPFSTNTKKTYMTFLRKLAKFLEKDGVAPLHATTEHIRRFLMTLRGRRPDSRPSAETTSHYLSVMDHLYRDLKAQGLRSDNPIEALLPHRAHGRRSTHTTLLSPKQNHALEAYIKGLPCDTFAGARRAGLLAVALGCGLLVTELRFLRVQAICLDHTPAAVYVFKSDSRPSMHVTLPLFAEAVLRRWLRQRELEGVAGDLAFPATTHGDVPLSQQTLHRWALRALGAVCETRCNGALRVMRASFVVNRLTRQKHPLVDPELGLNTLQTIKRYHKHIKANEQFSE